MTDRQFDELPSLLERARVRLLDVVDGLPDDALAFRPAPQEWNVLEVLEHVWLSERLYAMAGRRLLASLPVGRPTSYDSVPATRAAGVTSPRIAAPSFALPAGELDLPALQTRLARSRGRILALWEALRDRDSAAATTTVPEVGFVFNAGQLVHMAGLHDRVHTRQIRDNLAAWRATEHAESG